MDYISTNKNRESKVYVYLKQSYRVDGVKKIRTLKSLGSLESLISEFGNENILDELKFKAKEGELDDSNNTLTIELDPNELSDKKIFNYGYLLLDEVYSSLNMSKVVNTFDKNYKSTYSLDKVLKMLVYTSVTVKFILRIIPKTFEKVNGLFLRLFYSCS